MKKLLLFLLNLSLTPLAAAEGNAARVALVIGNDAYLHAEPLNAAVNDAKAVAATLQKLGFDTISASNAGLEQMVEALDALKAKAAGAQAVLVYYAGHGIESQGANYLLPVDARLEKEVQLQTQAVNLNSVLEKLTVLNVPARMVILDCCRDNPLQGRSWLATRSAGGGGGLGELPVQSLPAATLVVYAASPGKPAMDRLAPTDLHSPFTQALLDSLPQPGVHSFEVFGRVEEAVLNRTEGRQGPRVFYNGSTLPFRTFRFAAGPESAVAAPAPMTIIQPAPAVAVVTQVPPPTLPASGFFDLASLYVGGPYLSYNAYSRGKILEKVQEKLKAGGLYSGGVDGAPGPGTQRGILAWQQARALPVTGLLDGATLGSLDLVGITPMIAPPSGLPRTQRASTPVPAARRSGGEMSNEEFLRRARQLEGF